MPYPRPETRRPCRGSARKSSAARQYGVQAMLYGLLLPSGTWTFPLAKAEKRFHNGHEDSLAFYGSVIADMA